MKKFHHFVLLGLMMTLAACLKDETTAPDTGATSQTITVTVPQNGVQTRAVDDNFSKGTLVNRCILEIYRGDALYQKIEEDVTAGKATFNLQLVSSQTYDFVFWADCADGNKTSGFTDKTYVTSNGLKNITENGEFVGNSDGRDAFCYHMQKRVDGAFTEPVTLTRPFGLLVVKTLDLGAIQDESLKPTKYTVNFKGLPNAFNALTDEVSGSADVTYTAELAKADGTISMDFLWATDDKADLSDFSMTFLNNGTEITTNDAFKNIPIRRNYKTTVTGNLLTKKGTINVMIDPEFNTPDYEETITEVATTEEANTALAEGKTNIVVAEAPTAKATIEIPHSYAETNASVSIQLPATTEPVTVAYTSEQTANAPAAVSISIPSSENLTINLPSSTVTLNGEAYASVEAATADNTLIIPEGTTVKTLTVNKGNVEIYGTVTNPIVFNEGAGVVKVYSVADAASLKAAGALVAAGKCEKIVLVADVNLKGSADNLWTPINTEKTAFKEFDGGNHTITGLMIDNYTGQTDSKGTYYGGLFYVLQGATVKDLTIDGAAVTCFRGGVLAGRMDNGTIENCRIRNATVTGYQKVGGLIGYVNASANGDLTVSGCSVEGCSMKTTAPEEGLFQAGGLIGYLQSFDRNVLIEGNSVSGISFDKVYESADDVADKVYDMEQYYSHAFIGTIANLGKTDKYDMYKIELRNNKVAQQIDGIPTCDRTTEFIGWWAGDYNSSGYNYSRKIIVDGVTYDRWIEQKRLVAQINAGGEVNVWRNYLLMPKDKETGIATIYISSVESVAMHLQKGATLTAQEGTNMQQSVMISKSCKTMTIDGNGSIVGPSNGTYANCAAIYSNCPDLVIDGEVTVDGGSGSKGTNAAVRVVEGTTTIKNGYFKVGKDLNGNANSCILVAAARPNQEPTLKIYGGVFETEGSAANGWYPVINVQDDNRGRATVEIYGGTFVNYDPATGDNTGEAGDTFVAPGYKSQQTTYNGKTAWEVVPAE